MKKTLILLILTMGLFGSLSCGEATNTQNQGTGTATPNASSNSSLSNYSVIIESCRLSKDFQDNPIVIVKYKFTNNDNEPASFTWSIDHKVYQNGIGLNECYFVDDSANYSSDNQTKELKQGATLEIEVAYELNDTVTNIEVEVSELFSFNGKKIQKTFSIK